MEPFVFLHNMTKRPTDKPSMPLDLKEVETSKDAVVLKWKKPESDGNSKIISYVVEKKDDEDVRWKKVSETCSDRSIVEQK